MANNGSLPAMPCEVVEQYHINPVIAPDGSSMPTLRERKVMSGGMTKREMMAMHICAEIAGSIDSEECYLRIKAMAERCGVNVSQWIARDAVKQADALLAELEHNK